MNDGDVLLDGGSNAFLFFDAAVGEDPIRTKLRPPVVGEMRIIFDDVRRGCAPRCFPTSTIFPFSHPFVRS